MAAKKANRVKRQRRHIARRVETAEVAALSEANRQPEAAALPEQEEQEKLIGASRDVLAATAALNDTLGVMRDVFGDNVIVQLKQFTTPRGNVQIQPRIYALATKLTLTETVKWKTP